MALTYEKSSGIRETPWPGDCLAFEIAFCTGQRAWPTRRVAICQPLPALFPLRACWPWTENLQRQRVLPQLLDWALQWARSEVGIEALGEQRRPPGATPQKCKSPGCFSRGLAWY